MEKRVYGYVRVSSKEQNEDRQVSSILSYCKEKDISIQDRDIFMDKQSGKDFERISYQSLKHHLRKGDLLIIKELDRLGRNMDMIKEEWQTLIHNGVEIIVIDTEILNTSNKSDLEKKLIANIVFELLTYMAEKDRIKIRQRQREGIDEAKKRGKHLGRPIKVNYDKLNIEQITILKEYYPLFNKERKERGITAEEFRNKLNLSRSKFYEVIKEYRKREEQYGLQ